MKQNKHWQSFDQCETIHIGYRIPKKYGNEDIDQSGERDTTSNRKRNEQQNAFPKQGWTKWKAEHKTCAKGAICSSCGSKSDIERNFNSKPLQVGFEATSRLTNQKQTMMKIQKYNLFKHFSYAENGFYRNQKHNQPLSYHYLLAILLMPCKTVSKTKSKEVDKQITRRKCKS